MRRASEVEEEIPDIPPDQLDSANQSVCVISHHSLGLTIKSAVYAALSPPAYPVHRRRFIAVSILPPTSQSRQPQNCDN